MAHARLTLIARAELVAEGFVLYNNSSLNPLNSGEQVTIHREKPDPVPPGKKPKQDVIVR